eukprot:4020175-Pleurochrysis_carterae.AAC.1
MAYMKVQLAATTSRSLSIRLGCDVAAAWHIGFSPLLHGTSVVSWHHCQLVLPALAGSSAS